MDIIAVLSVKTLMMLLIGTFMLCYGSVSAVTVQTRSLIVSDVICVLNIILRREVIYSNGDNNIQSVSVCKVKLLWRNTRPVRSNYETACN